MANGLKVSLTTYDASIATPEQSAVSSLYPSPKAEVSHIGLLTYTFGGDPALGVVTNLYTIAHGYSFTPASIVYIQDVAGGTIAAAAGSLAIMPVSLGSGFYYGEFMTHTDGTNLKIDIFRYDAALSLAGLTFKFKYYIFAESGS